MSQGLGRGGGPPGPGVQKASPGLESAARTPKKSNGIIPLWTEILVE
jgi:hypothetical protein